MVLELMKRQLNRAVALERPQVAGKRPSLGDAWRSPQGFRWRDSRHALGHLPRFSGSG